MSADELSARGIIRAEIDATISSELVAQIAALPLKPGEAFRKADVLVRFDCQKYEAERRAVAAELKSTRLQVTANEKLLRHRAVGVVETEISRARRDEAAARLDAMLVRERQCEISAPFAGHVVERHVQLHEMSSPNGPLLRIVNAALEIDLIVPSEWIRWVRKDTPFRFRIEETGREVDAHIERLSAVVDPVSRTMRVTARISSQAPDARPGMSGEAIFRKPKENQDGR